MSIEKKLTIEQAITNSVKFAKLNGFDFPDWIKSNVEGKYQYSHAFRGTCHSLNQGHMIELIDVLKTYNILISNIENFEGYEKYL